MLDSSDSEAADEWDEDGGQGYGYGQEYQYPQQYQYDGYDR